MPSLRTPLALSLLLCACGDPGDVTIGPRGGELTSADGRLTVSIPQGALDEELPVAIVQSEYCMPDALACYDLLPNGTVPGLPALLTYEIDEGELGGGRPEGLAMYFQMGDSMVEAPDRVVDLEDGIVSASVYYFGPVTIFAK